MKSSALLRSALLLLATMSLGGCAGMYFKDAGAPPPAPALAPDLAHWPYREYWTGIVFNGAKIGFARLALAPAAEEPGRYDIDSEAVFTLRFLGLAEEVRAQDPRPRERRSDARQLRLRPRHGRQPPAAHRLGLRPYRGRHGAHA
ncbi:MAG: hypothetical protein MZV65_52930 [Chromatiales bacterium]|nr:hypothetical protein [Chromatiales bacterium]